MRMLFFKCHWYTEPVMLSCRCRWRTSFFSFFACTNGSLFKLNLLKLFILTRIRCSLPPYLYPIVYSPTIPLLRHLIASLHWVCHRQRSQSRHIHIASKRIDFTQLGLREQSSVALPFSLSIDLRGSEDHVFQSLYDRVSQLVAIFKTFLRRTVFAELASLTGIWWKRRTFFFDTKQIDSTFITPFGILRGWLFNPDWAISTMEPSGVYALLGGLLVGKLATSLFIRRSLVLVISVK